MKKIKYFALSLALLLLTGCGSKIMDAKVTSIYVDKNGAVTEAVIEDFDKDYYDEDELRNSISAAIDNYNSQIDKDAIDLVKFKIKDAVAKVYIKYDSTEDYTKFNGMKLFSGTIEEAKSAGFELPEMMNDVTGKKQVSVSELQDNSDIRVVILNQAIQVEVAKDILYTSENVSVNEERICMVADDGKEDDVSSTITGYAYIMYEL